MVRASFGSNVFSNLCRSLNCDSWRISVVNLLNIVPLRSRSVDQISYSELTQTKWKWKVLIFRVVVDDSDHEQLEVTIDPKEHKAYLWVTEEEVRSDLCGDVRLEWISLNQKKTILEAFEQPWIHSWGCTAILVQSRLSYKCLENFYSLTHCVI